MRTLIPGAYNKLKLATIDSVENPVVAATRKKKKEANKEGAINIVTLTNKCKRTRRSENERKSNC